MPTRTHVSRFWKACLLALLAPATLAAAQVGQPPVDPPALALPTDQDTLFTLTPPVQLEWGEVAGVGTYEAQVFTTPDVEGQEPLPFRSRALDDPFFELPSADLLAIADTARTFTYYWRVRARNNEGEGPWSEVWEFTIDLRPTVGPIDTQIVDELQELAFTAPASDPLGGVLTFSLDPASLALGMTIDPATGAFAWTPTEDQGPGSYTVTIEVTTEDGVVSAVTFEVNVGEVNAAPVLAPIGDQQVAANTELTFTAVATDEDVPANTLTYSLDPDAIALGMTIDPVTGVFNWTPHESYDPGVYPVTITVTDDGNPALSASETISVQVGEFGIPPVIDAIADQSVDEGVALALTVSGADVDTPPDSLTFALDPASLALGMTIAGLDSTSATVSWTPAEDQGPGVYTVTVYATDDSGSALTDSTTFVITVNEVNAPPVLDAIGDQAGAANVEIAFTATATDPDIPANALVFSIDEASLALGMTIDAATGAFSWTPDETYDPGVYPVTVTVTDNGAPALSDAETIALRVGEVGIAPVVDSLADQSVDEGSTLVVLATGSDGDTPPDSLTFNLDEASLALGMTIAGVDSSSATISWTPTEAQGPGSYDVTLRATDDSAFALFTEITFTVVVNEVNLAPELAEIADQTAITLQTLTVQAAATDSDLPENTLTYRLDAASLALGMSVDPATGAFSWTPGGALVGATPTATLYVDDRPAGDPALLTDSTTFVVTVDGGAPTLGTPDGACSVLAEFPLNWAELPSADQYIVEIDASPGFTSPVRETVTGPPFAAPLATLNEDQVYYWRVIGINSVAGVSGVPSEFRSFSRWPATISLAHTLTYPKATESGDFRMVSVPGQAQDLALPATFPGQSEGTDWRVFRDNSVVASYPTYLVQYEPGQNAADFEFEPGVGYWAISSSAWTVPQLNVASVPLDQPTSSFFGIPLNQGATESDARWTMIGNPYDFPVSWQAIREANGLVAGDDLWDWTGQQYESVDLMEPYKGYYFFNRPNLPQLAMPCDLRVTPGAPTAVRPDLAEHLDLTVFGEVDGQVSPVSSVRVGVHEAAAAAVDAYDRFVPPAYFERTRVTLVNEALDTRYPYLVQDARAELGEGQSFMIEIKAVPGESVPLSVQGLDGWMGAGAMLIDPVLGRTYDLNATPTIRLEPTVEFSRYQLLVGDAAFLEKARLAAVPTEYRLLQSYPNPFAERTTIEYALPEAGPVRIEVYNVLGQRVSMLVSQSQEAGLHRVTWDGRGDGGEPAASGVYFYVLESNDFRATRRMIITR